jgi:DNA-binding protein Alba
MCEPNSQSSVTIGAKRTLEYVYDALSRLNLGSSPVILRGIGNGLSKCVEVANILSEHFGVIVSDSGLVTYRVNSRTASGIEIAIQSPASFPASGTSTPNNTTDFIEFPVYQLLLSAYINAFRKVTVVVEDRYNPLDRASIAKTIDKRAGRHIAVLDITDANYDCKLSVPAALTERNITKEKRENILADVAAALGRAGVVQSKSWVGVTSMLSDFDDLVLGLDTNILRECVVSQQLMDGFMFNHANGHFQAPNWLLVIVPNGVVHEIEQIANSRGANGKLTKVGRLGYRALAEILELDQSKDLVGLSLLIVGEADPILDTRVELRGLREDMEARSVATAGPKVFKKLSMGDSHIRDQFKQFLRQICFHKGAFFVTEDKSNSALAQAEGLRSIYYGAVRGDIIQRANMEVELTQVMTRMPLDEGGKPEKVMLSVPLGKVMFELAVQFDRVWLSAGEKSVLLECDSTGESLMHWVHRRVRIDRKEMRKLREIYDKNGRVSLWMAEEVWRKLNESFMEGE